MCRLAALFLIALPSLASAQSIVVSPKPDKVAVTVYRDPNGSGEMELNWLGGFALITETRRVTLPAGEVDLRFEGVAGGLIPQSAVVSGLSDGVSEKNRDAKLLSPGTLIDSYLGQRVHLRRTSKATGKVTEQEAIVRASGDGIVVQTESGVEALRCTGLNETLLARNVPADLSAKPTLSVRARSAQAVETTVTLTYLTSNFDWRAHYVATLAPDGKSMSLFAWLTLANGDETGFADADTMAVAGRLNREDDERLEPETRSLSLTCWPNHRTHEEDEMRPDLEAPSPVTVVSAEQFDLTGTVRVETLLGELPQLIATRENLGDLKLYRIPIPVSVASNSQKQVAMIGQPNAKVETFYLWRYSYYSGEPEPKPAERVLRFENRESDGLGLPLPSGSFTLYTIHDGRPFMLGEGIMKDRAVGEQVDVSLTDSPGVRVLQLPIKDSRDKEIGFDLTAINDQPYPVRFLAWFGDKTSTTNSSGKIVRRDGARGWEVELPANGSRTLQVRSRKP